MHIHQLLDAVRAVLSRSTVGHLDVTPAPQRLAHHEQVARPLPFVFAVLLGVLAQLFALAWLWRLLLPHLAEELPARLIEAHHRAFRIIRQHVGLDHVFHPPDVLAVGIARHTPAPDAPPLDTLFFG